MSDQQTPGSVERYWTRSRLLLATLATVIILPALIVGGHRLKLIVLRRTAYSSELEKHRAFFDAVDKASSDAADEASQLPLAEFNTQRLRVPADEIKSGGPPRDAIPALTDPHTTLAADAMFLDDDARVVGVTVDGAARAYPFSVLTWHEAINDQLGGHPIAVFYCPLCDSVSVIDRRIGGKTLTFGVSGLLHNSNVLLYDRVDYGLWSQVGLKAISGPFSGDSLEHLPWEITTFGAWRERYPDSTVVSHATGHDRDYARNPYESYFEGSELRFPVSNRDDRLPLMSRVIGVRVGDVTRAYPLDALQPSDGGPEDGAQLEDEIAGQRLVLRTSRASGDVAIIESPDDAEIVHTFWFAWAAFHAETGVFGQ